MAFLGIGQRGRRIGRDGDRDAGSGGGGWWRRRLAKRRSKAETRALATLRVIRERYLACEALTPIAFVRVSGVLHRFLNEHCGIPARAETIEQIRERFRGHPLERDLARVLEQCDEVVYDANRPVPSDKERIIREVATLIGELERTGCRAECGTRCARGRDADG